MKTSPPLQTMQLSYRQICAGEGKTPWVPLGNFTNHFFYWPRRRNELVQDPIEEPAEPTPEMHQWAVFCAASVDYLCQKYHVPLPEWVNAPAYAPLREPWFFAPAAHHLPDVRKHYERETPEAFARRNIFCGNRVYLNKREEANKLRRRLQRQRSKRPSSE
jgi:hypothetical protein